MGAAETVSAICSRTGQRHSGFPRGGVDHRPAVPAVGDEPVHRRGERRRRILAPAALGSGYINGDANPAHIIYECLKQRRGGWATRQGRSMRAVSRPPRIRWPRAVRTVLALGTRAATGEFPSPRCSGHRWHALRPSAQEVRAQAGVGLTTTSPASLVLDALNILELEASPRPLGIELVNQITVRYRDRSTDKGCRDHGKY